MPKTIVDFIKALRQAADVIEHHPDRYSWGNSSACNCGIVAQQFLGEEQDIIFSRFRDSVSQLKTAIEEPNHVGYIWSTMAYACSNSGLTVGTILEQFFECGLKAYDIENLEYLSDKTVLREAGLPEDVSYQDPSNVVKYMRAWANILCRKQCQKETNATT